ncbi:MAG: phosphoribosylanthranilate isomerase [Chloroflexi bacterium]|nr:phosphoribosylanthranilate isomerase [Chloroflexota bacterium]
MTQIKICGITNLEDAMVAVQAGADMLGFIFYPPSPRYIIPERASEIILVIRHASPVTRFVGVFVNASLEHVRAVMALAQLDFAQLHGDELVEMVRTLNEPRRVSGNPLGLAAYKSLRLRNADDTRTQIETYRDAVNGNTPTFLLDAYDAKQFGGTGKRADWDIASEIARTFPILLAGGLNAENVADAIRTVQPWGVDVSSGVERAPGLKDHARVDEFIRAVKSMSDDRTVRSAVVGQRSKG